MINSASVSKDGPNVWARGHPSRRAQERAPQDEAGYIFTRSIRGRIIASNPRPRAGVFWGKSLEARRKCPDILILLPRPTTVVPAKARDSYNRCDNYERRRLSAPRPIAHGVWAPCVRRDDKGNRNELPMSHFPARALSRILLTPVMAGLLTLASQQRLAAPPARSGTECGPCARRPGDPLRPRGQRNGRRGRGRNAVFQQRTMGIRCGSP